MAVNNQVYISSANSEVSLVYDDIKKTRNTNTINNFWKHLANNPILLRETWDQFKGSMADGEISALMKELIILLCRYPITAITVFTLIPPQQKSWV